MDIYNQKKHQECFCYQQGKEAMVEIKRIEQGVEEKITLATHEVVFMIEGELSYKIGNYNPVALARGQFMFVPIGRTLSYKTKANCLIFIIKQNNTLRFCHSFSIESLHSDIITPPEITPLEINKRLYHYINGLIETYQDGIMCSYFFEAKITEFFVLLRAYYSDQQLSGMFLTVLSPDVKFSEAVFRNYNKYKTINEMASAMRLTPVQFADRFRKVFAQ